jgi:hypothetical protein
MEATGTGAGRVRPLSSEVVSSRPRRAHALGRGDLLDHLALDHLDHGRCLLVREAASSEWSATAG